MKYLLDSHVVDWALNDDSRLSAKARELLNASVPGDLAIADVTLSELARHLAAGVIKTKLAAGEWLRLATNGLEVLPVTHEIAVQAATLDWVVAGRPHRDPCDRHIVATAAAHRLPLVTIDEKMHALTGIRGFKAVW